MKTYRYFAYGSNLHPERLRARVPSSRFIDVAQLRRHTLKIHKRGMDGSGKCNAFYTGDNNDLVIGAVYEFDAIDKAVLDQYEDQGQGYEWQTIEVEIAGELLWVHSYLATPDHIDDSLRPFSWYKELVLIGMRYHDYPAAYQAMIEAITSIEDPSADRVSAHEQLIHFLSSE